MFIIDLEEIKRTVSGTVQHKNLHQGLMIFLEGSPDNWDQTALGFAKGCESQNQLYPIAKILAWAEQRNTAIKKMKERGKIKYNLATIKLSGYGDLRRIPQHQNAAAEAAASL